MITSMRRMAAPAGGIHPPRSLPAGAGKPEILGPCGKPKFERSK